MDGGAVVADDAPTTLLSEVERLVRLGVRPLDLDRLARARGWATRPTSVAAAAARLTFRRPVASPPPVPPGAPLLAADELEYAYAPGRGALAGVSLSIAAGEFVALIGQNGSGKTTLAKCLNGLLVPHRGAVRVRGVDLRSLPAGRVAADVGYVFQDPDQQIFAATVAEEVGFALANRGVPVDEATRRVAAVLEAVGLAGCERRDPFLLGKGQRQRLAVASLLVLEPAVLILDEPTTGLDHREQRQMLALLAALHRRGLTVVVITHSPWVVAEYAGRGVVLRGGAVAFDGPLRDLFAEEALLEACRFRLPDATRVGRQLGFTPLSVEELLAGVEP
jgi:energy-coupling factor transport system ATP-binding protein